MSADPGGAGGRPFEVIAVCKKGGLRIDTTPGARLVIVDFARMRRLFRGGDADGALALSREAVISLEGVRDEGLREVARELIAELVEEFVDLEALLESGEDAGDYVRNYVRERGSPRGGREGEAGSAAEGEAVFHVINVRRPRGGSVSAAPHVYLVVVDLAFVQSRSRGDTAARDHAEASVPRLRAVKAPELRAVRDALIGRLEEYLEG